MRPTVIDEPEIERLFREGLRREAQRKRSPRQEINAIFYGRNKSVIIERAIRESKRRPLKPLQAERPTLFGLPVHISTQVPDGEVRIERTTDAPLRPRH